MKYDNDPFATGSYTVGKHIFLKICFRHGISNDRNTAAKPKWKYYRLLLNRLKGKKLKDCARIWGSNNTERARQVEAKALRKVREFIQRHNNGLFL
jgi:hypothetical protein